MLNVLALVGVAAASSIRVATPSVATQYAGTLNYHPFADEVPLNVTVDAKGLATFEWTYDKAASGTPCTPDTESGLAWSVTGTVVKATGLGKDPSFYSFDGSLNKGTITGVMIQQNTGAKVGMFKVTEGAPMVPSKCKAPPGPPPAPPAPPAHPTTNALIWPLPTEYTRGTTTVGVTVGDASQFFKTAGGASTPFLSQAFARYADLTFSHRVSAANTANATAAKAGAVTGLVVTVASTDDSHPQVETDESYTLTVSAAGGAATMTAKTVYGVLRGLETFSQMVVFDFDTGVYTIPQAPWQITDAPRFPHRGLMIDSARHFEPVAAIKGIVDSLPYAKLNVLHWHMSDSQSFPLQIKSSPKLWAGAWSSQERYIQGDVEDVVEYARLRGVRVMVEFDMPGHAASWCTGYPEICPSVSCNQPLNVANDKTFDVITGLLMEMTGGVANKPDAPSTGIFKSNMIHLGGDEVNTACWDSTPAVAAWMKTKGYTADQAYAYFVKKVADVAIAQGHRPVQWSEVFDHFKYNLTKETIVHIWKSVTNVTEVVAGGYDVLVNVGYDKLSWYLDNLNVMWDAVYMNEPCVGVPDDLCDKHVLGGHGEMWGETVDASDIEQTVWPRLAAISERLWSPRNLTDTADAKDRIQSFRCLLNRRGIAAAPVNNADARSAPPGPGSCFNQ